MSDYPSSSLEGKASTSSSATTSSEALPRRVFLCYICNNEYGEQERLVQHNTQIHQLSVSRITEDGNIKCEFCGKCYGRFHFFVNHQREYHDFDPLNKTKQNARCTKCEKIFTSEEVLLEHTRSRHYFDAGK